MALALGALTPPNDRTFKYHWGWKKSQLWSGSHYASLVPEIFVVVLQSLSRVQLFVTPCTAVCQASLSFTITWSLLKLMSIKSVMSSNRFILCRPLFLPPSIFPRIRVFSNKSVIRIRWPNIGVSLFSPCNEYSGLISFRMDWLDLLALQVTLKSLLQHHSSKASIHWHSAFYIFQLLHSCMTTGKTIALTSRTLVSKIMSLLLNMLSRLVITFFPRSKHIGK